VTALGDLGRHERHEDDREHDPGLVVLVPRPQVDKYADLLSFYKDIMELSTVCDELRIEYTEAIAHHPDRASLARVDPCMVVRTLAPTDIFDKQ